MNTFENIIAIILAAIAYELRRRNNKKDNEKTNK